MDSQKEIAVQMLNSQVLPIEQYADGVVASTPAKEETQILREITNGLYRQPGPLSDALYGDLVTMYHAGGDIARVTGPGSMSETVDWALLKLAQDLIKTQPERVGLTGERAAILDGKVQTVIDKMRKSGIGVNDETEMRGLDLVTDQAIERMRENGLLHLTRAEAASKFPESQIEAPKAGFFEGVAASGGYKSPALKGEAPPKAGLPTTSVGPK